MDPVNQVRYSAHKLLSSVHRLIRDVADLDDKEELDRVLDIVEEAIEQYRVEIERTRRGEEY